MARRLQFMYTDVASVPPHIKAGKALPLAVDHKTSLLPGVGSFAEAGLQFDAPTSFSVMAPTGTPQPILRRLADEVQKALTILGPKLEQQALVPVHDTPDEFATSLKAERASWAEFVKRKGITMDQ